MAQVIEGDLLKTERGILVHQVNCRGVMGAGLALQIRNKWPQVFDLYRHIIIGMDKNDRARILLGETQFVYVGPNLYVCNLFGQNKYNNHKNIATYKSSGAVFTDYNAHRIAWPKINRASNVLRLPVYVPWGIGCGLAGGDWETMRELVENHCPDVIWVKKV